MIDYRLIRTPRKSVSLRVMADSVLEVRAPFNLPKDEIDRIVESKSAWITERLEKRERLNSEKALFKLNYGSLLRYRGNKYPLTAREGRAAGFDGECFYLPPELGYEDIVYGVTQIYRSLAKPLMDAKVEQFSKIMGVRPSSVKINGASKRWGSCSNKHNLNFSWKLIMAGDELIDYIAVHELAHILELNHSPRFWAVVESVLPDYRERAQGMKNLQELLAAEDWE